MLRRHGLNGLQHSTHAYNCTMSQTTGFSFFLMFGRIPKIPIDVGFSVTLTDLSDTNWQNYAQKLKAWLKWAYRKVNEVNLKEAARHKKYYDHKFKCMKLVPGDTVLVKIKAFNWKGSSWWLGFICNNVGCVSNVSFLLWSSVLKLNKTFSSTSFNLKQEVFIRTDEEKTWRGWYL